MLKGIKLQWKRRYLPYLIAHGGKMLVRTILSTCRIKIHGLNAFVSTAKSSPCILMLWHNKLVLVSEILNTHTSNFIFRAFISKSRDGEPLAMLAESYKGGRVLRVPHNTRHRALSKMIGSLKDQKEIILITPDGPRGPKHVVKPGIVVAARESAAKIVPFSWKSGRYWQLNTWDQMKIPKPFSTIHVAFGPAITLNKNEDEDIDRDTALLNSSLQSLEDSL